VIRRGTLDLGSPLKATVAYNGIKAGGDPSKSKSDICHSDAYLVISNFFKLCREINFILVMTIS